MSGKYRSSSLFLSSKVPADRTPLVLSRYMSSEIGRVVSYLYTGAKMWCLV